MAEASAPLDIQVFLKKSVLDEEIFRRNPGVSNAIIIADRLLEKWLNAFVGGSGCCGVCGDAQCRTIIFDGRTC